MFNNSIDKSIRLSMAKRIYGLIKNNQDLKNLSDFCYLYSKDNIVSKAAFYVLLPYHKFKYYLLAARDYIESDKLLSGHKGKTGNREPANSQFDWQKERDISVEYAKKAATNNEFTIEDTYYDKFIRNSYDVLRAHYKDQSFLKSPEYDDFKLLLDLCKDQGIKPLFVNVPVKGKWFDYIGFDKNDRDEYYKRINEMVQSYGFDLADFSQYEYDDYFLKDIFHIGWEGWVYINEAMDKYYHEK
jgi:D-alanine transfer protein